MLRQPCHNALGLAPPMPTLELTPTGRNKWTLEETAVVTPALD
jgi:hypothetical protein